VPVTEGSGFESATIKKCFQVPDQELMILAGEFPGVEGSEEH
jgi:hypothetical protein